MRVLPARCPECGEQMKTRTIDGGQRWYCHGTWILAPLVTVTPSEAYRAWVDAAIRTMVAHRPMLLVEIASRLDITVTLARSRARRVATVFDSKAYHK